MTLELTITLIFALCFAARGQSGMLLDPTVGPQPATGFRVSVATAPITADFSFSPSSGAWPLTVQFVDLTQGGPSGWAWNFGDGSATNTSQNPIHTYNSASTFTAILVATGPGGSSSASHTVTVTNAPTWASGYGGTLNDSGSAVAVDSSQNIFLVGVFKGTSNFGGTNMTSAGGQAMVLAKYANNRVHQWSEQFSTASDVYPRAISLDGSGNIFVAGYFTGTVNLGGTNLPSAGSYDCFLAKYNSSGVHQWSQRFGSTGSDIFYGMVVDSAGNAVVAGTFQFTVNFGGTNLTTVGFSHIVLAKYTTTGAHTWSQTFTSSNNNYAYALGLDSSDNILITGSFFSSINFGGGNLTAVYPPVEDLYVSKFTSGGAFTWAVGHGGTNTVRGLAVCADTNNNAIVSGLYFRSTDLGGGTIVGTATDSDGFLAKYSAASGAYSWADNLIGNFGLQPASVALNKNNNDIIAGGLFYGTFNFGGQLLTSVANSVDGWIARYDNTGILQTVVSYGSIGSDSVGWLVVDSACEVVGTGSFTGTVNFQGNTMTALGGNDAILFRMTP